MSYESPEWTLSITISKLAGENMGCVVPQYDENI
jgi:hypothetical protein